MHVVMNDVGIRIFIWYSVNNEAQEHIQNLHGSITTP